jgi:ketosteroid isomerase-like protein
MLGDDVAIITSYNVATGNPPAVKEQTTYLVRGTFVVQKIGGKWLIVYEHSSMMPEE